MSLSNSLYAGISGLSTMGNSMNVLGDNIANVNTTAYKSSRATFQDVLSQSVATSSGTAQVGRGVTLTTVDGLFAQGSFESTSNPTDMAIGGEGFFMLRGSESAEADMFTRAGEFRFDSQGNLTSPAGHFVQGWDVDKDSGQIEGTIGDINLQRSTPPVPTEKVEMIVNLDSRKPNEDNEQRLFDSWDATNLAKANPTEPINEENFEYTTSVKVYDSKGAAHDITVYFDRTTEDNKWEYLVTCDPTADKRNLDDKQQRIYAPNEQINYEEHKGAGALMYGEIDFSPAGAIEEIAAWDVPPDGIVDPAQSTNRKELASTDSYYSFAANFTGAPEAQDIDLNFGARYSPPQEPQSQVLVSNNRAFSDETLENPINSETPLTLVYDASAQPLQDGDLFTWSGYKPDGTQVSGNYEVAGDERVSDLLAELENTFGPNSSASIDADGRLQLTDTTGGESALHVTSFNTYAKNEADPFGGNETSTDRIMAVSTGQISDENGNAIGDGTTFLTKVSDETGSGTLQSGDSFTFSGTTISGGTVSGTFNVTASGTQDLQDLMTWMENLYTDGDSTTASNGAVEAILDNDGQIRLVDHTGSTNLEVVLNSTNNTALRPLGDDGSTFTSVAANLNGQVDISTSKKQVVADHHARTPGGSIVTEDTAWTNISVDGDSDTTFEKGDTITFEGFKGGSGTQIEVDANFTVGTDHGESLSEATGSVQDLLTWLEDEFDATAMMDGAGRLVLTDWRGGESNLDITGVAYTDDAAGPGDPLVDEWNAFGDGTFKVITAGDEDGSQRGKMVSSNFETEAMNSTQYANSSTTIFQDQDGFAAGFLQSVSVDTEGIITGNFSNGQVLMRAQVALANFANLQGLHKVGGNIFRATTESGAPVTGQPGTNGLGEIAPNSLEQSNVDLGNEFVKMITTQRGFQANSKMITTTDEMLNELINIKR
ncbi:MAG: flagellar hook-basal body complex protein [Desulfurivibrio sp.]|nr:flagellar hook-basal body complex protein [Desulfurivibrio sp.]